MPATYRLLTLLPALCLALLQGCSQESPSTPDAASGQQELVAPAPSAFRIFLDENYAVDMARQPMTASSRGIMINNDQWDPESEAFKEETRAINAARLEQLTAFDRAALAPAEQLSYDLYRLDLERLLASDEFRHYLYVIHNHRGPHTSAPGDLINVHRISGVGDAQDYIARLHNLGGYFDELVEQLEIRTAEGLRMAPWQYARMIDASRNVIRGVPFSDNGVNSTLWADFTGKVAVLEINDAQRDGLMGAARAALLESVAPAYERLIAALQAQAVGAPDVDGVWKFPRGDAFYAERLRWYTTTDYTADEVHALGLREVSRIHEEMRAIMRRVNFDGSLADFMNFLRDDPRFYYPDSDAGRDAYLAEVRRQIDAMQARLPAFFGRLPQADLVVKRVEPFRQRTAGKAFYQKPPRDGSRPGIYYINLYDMSSIPKYQLPALAFHEGVPGHHLQRAVSIELPDIPDFQIYVNFLAFTEGWGLYSEELAKEMGFYQDPYEDFGRLALELRRACRLVVDTGIHSKRWTRQQAIDYLLATTPDSVVDASKSIERYIAQPGQATAYMIGKLKIMELRERARAALGENFDIRAFHDAVLEDGPVPLSMLERRIEDLSAG